MMGIDPQQYIRGVEAQRRHEGEQEEGGGQPCTLHPPRHREERRSHYCVPDRESIKSFQGLK